MQNKLLLIGWDAADWQIIHPLMEAGRMPALKYLVEQGVSGNLATLEPVFSPMLWTSIATGKRADKHGVLGFTEPDYDHGGVKPVGTNSRKTAAIWNMLTEAGLKSNVVGWWPSHPAEELNGIMVSNFYQRAVATESKNWPMAPGTVYPKQYQKVMSQLRVHPKELTQQHILPFIPEAAKIDQEKDKRLSTFAKILSEAACIHNSATYLMEETDWDFMAVYFDNIDHFSHAFMRYHPPQLKKVKDLDFEIYQGVVNAAYQYHDMMLGRMLNLTDEDTTIVLISDHGFESGKNRLLSLPKEAGAPAYDHRSYGVFAAMGPGIKKDELVYGANLLDITPTLLYHFDLPLGKDMDGKPLINIFKESKEVKYINSWDNHVQRESKEKTDPKAAAEAMKMMIELGYIEKPNEDSEKAQEKSRIENEFNLARVYLSSGRSKEAAEILEELMKNNDESRFGLRLIVAYDSLKEYKKCLEVIERIESNSKKPIQQIIAMKAMTKLKMRQRKEALGIAQTIVKQRPQTAFAAQRVARILISLKKNKMADKYLERSIGYFPENATLLYLKGMSSYRNKKYEEAAIHFLDSVNLQFFNPKTHLYIGEVMMRLEKWEEAFRAYTIAYGQNPKSKKALKGLAELEDKGHQFELQETQEVQFHSKREDSSIPTQAKETYLSSLLGTVYIVSGLPRSGTSMMMQMLKAGGAKLFIDEKRKADKSNPKGYYEHDGIKALGKNKKLIEQAKDHVVKVVSPQLKHLLPKFKYKVIFMDRDISEVITSQNKMSGNEIAAYSFKLHQFYQDQIEELDKQFFRQLNVEVLRVSYHEAIENPAKIAKDLSEFLDELKLDEKFMASAVDKKLYRNKKGDIKV